MPTLKVYPHGFTLGTPPGTPNREPPMRGEVNGWTTAAARRNTAFLRSVDLSGLTGRAVSFTLTLKDCPPTAADWTRLREAFFMRCRRAPAPLLRLHWVTEWQRRGVPHLHGVAYFDTTTPASIIGRNLVEWWTAIAADYGARPRAQHTAPIHDALGWLQYLAKHASRGVRHYQRSAANVPPEWQNRTGRVWGYLGDWPKGPICELTIDRRGGFLLRRLLRSRAIADARAKGERKTIAAARRSLKCHERRLSEVRGMSGWASDVRTLDLVAFVAAQGHAVES